MFYSFTLIRINSLPPQPEKDLHAKGLILGLGRASKSKLQALSDEDHFKLTEVLTTDFETEKEQFLQPRLLKRYRNQVDVLDVELKRRRGDRERETS